MSRPTAGTHRAEAGPGTAPSIGAAPSNQRAVVPREIGTHEHLDMLRERQAARLQAQYGRAGRQEREFVVHTPDDAAAMWAGASQIQREIWMRT